jgi:PHD/YefM family antitoxin component YafN of YafNO toxin-antitoxin module
LPFATHQPPPPERRLKTPQHCNLTYFTYNTAHMQKLDAPLVSVPAGEFQRHIGRYQDLALTQPVAVTRNGRERTVMISAEEYYRLKRRDRQVMTLSDFTEAEIAALEATRAPETSKAFDHELT